MRVVILYHPGSEFAGEVEDYKREFEIRHPGEKLELTSLETKEGANLAELYDVVRYPAILAIEDNGSLQKVWQDRPLPLMDELNAYFQ
ncbi:MAG TPA: hypothetical protein VHD84_03220 [Candidatus Saccharimonadales bacterium]|nr:hypothetical protein [Candidatus Saccharimonadales bacterium]